MQSLRIIDGRRKKICIVLTYIWLNIPYYFYFSKTFLTAHNQTTALICCSERSGFKIRKNGVYFIYFYFFEHVKKILFTYVFKSIQKCLYIFPKSQ